MAVVERRGSYGAWSFALAFICLAASVISGILLSGIPGFGSMAALVFPLCGGPFLLGVMLAFITCRPVIRKAVGWWQVGSVLLLASAMLGFYLALQIVVLVLFGGTASGIELVNHYLLPVVPPTSPYVLLVARACHRRLKTVDSLEVGSA